MPKARFLEGADEKHLMISYKISSETPCNNPFHVFFSADGAPIDYTPTSAQHLGSYAVGASCNETFDIPLAAEIVSQANTQLTFAVVPAAVQAGNEYPTNISIDIR